MCFNAQIIKANRAMTFEDGEEIDLLDDENCEIGTRVFVMHFTDGWKIVAAEVNDKRTSPCTRG